ncbi:hypothetical protein F2Q68_00040876 [Brassica cretica]|uniref:Alpha/beta hydrolase fold-3 domain-containing protein n=1 Tax=Brassica cretica TaxID=69181 RepID=A0A8S9MLN9_BRACR|nr:hypothetical protein F2Q68_00040876 [Brassica cretica]
MDSDQELAYDYSPRFRVYKNGQIQRLVAETFVPPSLTPQNGVVSKDAVYSPEKNPSLRIYLPHQTLETTAGCIAFSVDYRRSPEHPIPIPYEDSWDAVKWILTHIAGSGPEDWVNDHADFRRVFVAGDSAGANIAHHMGIRAGEENGSFKISGMTLFHPFFFSKAILEEQEDGVRRYMEGIWEIAYQELAYEYSPRFRIYKNGQIQRLVAETFVPPSLTPQNGVVSKDAVYSPEKNLSLRIYLPHQTLETSEATKKKKKLPLLIYFHGGAFIMETAFSPAYNTFLTSTVSAAGCIAFSVNYRRAPDHPIPIPYEDSWDAVKWILTHIAGSGPEDWVNDHADFRRVFVAGDSAGANIAHHMAIRAGEENGSIIKISGLTLFHPFFFSRAILEEQEDGVRRNMEGIWEIACPNSEKGVEDPWINVVGSDLSGLECGRVLVMVARKDVLAREGRVYAEKLEESGLEGRVEVVETEDEDHVFHIRNPDSDNARLLVQRSLGVRRYVSYDGVTSPCLLLFFVFIFSAFCSLPSSSPSLLRIHFFFTKNNSISSHLRSSFQKKDGGALSQSRRGFHVELGAREKDVSLFLH